MKIVYVGDAADFHVRDKIVGLACEIGTHELSVFSGACIDGFNLSSLEGAKIRQLVRVDISFLAVAFHKQFVRNIIKLILYPYNIAWLFLYRISNKGSVFHAFTMYYIVLCALVCNDFIATPQASEVFHRMLSSRFYRLIALFSLKRSSIVIVDSVEMQNCLKNFGINAVLHKNGFDTDLARRVSDLSRVKVKSKLVSIRGIRPLYRITDIVHQRNTCNLNNSISFVYPGFDEKYRQEVFQLFRKGDEDLGMLNKNELYSLMAESLLCISIPKTDSSPRSVFEAIFCGCIVAVSQANYIDELPVCMKQRLIIIDLSSRNWLEQAVFEAKTMSNTMYVPSKEALDFCDSKFLIRKLISNIYCLP